MWQRWGTGREGLSKFKEKKVEQVHNYSCSDVAYYTLLSRDNDKIRNFFITKEQEWVGLKRNVKLEPLVNTVEINS